MRTYRGFDFAHHSFLLRNSALLHTIRIMCALGRLHLALHLPQFEFWKAYRSIKSLFDWLLTVVWDFTKHIRIIVVTALSCPCLSRCITVIQNVSHFRAPYPYHLTNVYVTRLTQHPRFDIRKV